MKLYCPILTCSDLWWPILSYSELTQRLIDLILTYYDQSRPFLTYPDLAWPVLIHLHLSWLDLTDWCLYSLNLDLSWNIQTYPDLYWLLLNLYWPILTYPDLFWPLKDPTLVVIDPILAYYDQSWFTRLIQTYPGALLTNIDMFRLILSYFDLTQLLIDLILTYYD